MFQYGDYVKIKERGSENENSYWLVVEENNGIPSKLLATGPTYEAMKKIFKTKKILFEKAIQKISPEWLATKKYTTLPVHRENVQCMLEQCIKADLLDEKYSTDKYIDTIMEREDYIVLLIDALIKHEKYEALASSFVKSEEEGYSNEQQEETK